MKSVQSKFIHKLQIHQLKKRRRRQQQHLYRKQKVRKISPILKCEWPFYTDVFNVTPSFSSKKRMLLFDVLRMLGLWVGFSGRLAMTSAINFWALWLFSWRLFEFMIKFGYNARCHWLKERVPSEYKTRSRAVTPFANLYCVRPFPVNWKTDRPIATEEPEEKY